MAKRELDGDAALHLGPVNVSVAGHESALRRCVTIAHGFLGFGRGMHVVLSPADTCPLGGANP